MRWGGAAALIAARSAASGINQVRQKTTALSREKPPPPLSPASIGFSDYGNFAIGIFPIPTSLF